MWWLMPLVFTIALLAVVMLPAILGGIIWGPPGFLVVGVAQAFLLKAMLVADRD